MQFLSPWTPALLAGAVLLGGLLVWLRSRRRHESQALPTDWALSARPVFTTDERRLYRQLREALPHHVVLSKLPLVRFSQPTRPGEMRFWYRLLGTSHVTFAVCSASGRVLVALDLDGERSPSRRNQQIKQAALKACRVRYVRCSPDDLPSVPELQALLPVPALSPRHAAPSAASATRDRLVSTVASRRQQRTNLWLDSSFAPDSRYSSLLPPLEPLDDVSNFMPDSRAAPLH